MTQRDIITTKFSWERGHVKGHVTHGRKLGYKQPRSCDIEKVGHQGSTVPQQHQKGGQTQEKCHMTVRSM